jgi:hypothetical protein
MYTILLSTSGKLLMNYKRVMILATLLREYFRDGYGVVLGMESKTIKLIRLFIQSRLPIRMNLGLKSGKCMR